MKLGLRLRILLLLGGLMVLAFGPLFYAVATYTRYALREAHQSSARALGRAGVEAIGVYDLGGQPVTRRGTPGAVDALPASVDARREILFDVETQRGPAWAVGVPDARGSGCLMGTVHTAMDRNGSPGEPATAARSPRAGLYCFGTKYSIPLGPPPCQDRHRRVWLDRGQVHALRFSGWTTERRHRT